MSSSVCTISKAEADIDAIITGMEETSDRILRQNRNPATKAAFIEIVQVLVKKEVNVDRLTEMVCTICLNDIREAHIFPIGSRVYLEQATALLLETLSDGRYALFEPREKILCDLLHSPYEEVILKTLAFINEFKPHDIVGIGDALVWLLSSNTSEQVRALILQSMSSIATSGKLGMSLRSCLLELEKANVLPLKEAWITLSGSAALEVLSLWVMLTSGLVNG